MKHKQSSNNKKKFIFIAAIIIPQICSFLFILLFPAKALEENLLFVFTLNIYFIFIIFFTALLAEKIFPRFMRTKQERACKKCLSLKSTTLLSILPILGLIFLIIDRIYIRGIDYSKELREARYEWLGSEGGTFFGIVGTIIIHVAYPSIFFALRNSSLLSKKKMLLLIITSITSVLGISILNGGRSAILFFLITITIAIATRAKTASAFIFTSKKKAIFLITTLFFISIFYVFKVIESSANLGQTSLADLMSISITEMHGVPSKDFFSDSHNNITYLTLYSLAYLFHSQWTTQSMYNLPDTPGYYSIISMPIMYLDKLGIINAGAENVPFYKEGLFLSLPGGIYYDFRWFGIILSAIIIGMFFGITLFYLTRLDRFGSLKMMIIISTLYILILSPAFAAYGLGHYFFIIFSFALIGMLSRLIFNEKIYY